VAYREFYEAPVPEAVNPLEHTVQAISGLFQSIGKANTDKRKAADQFAYDLNEGKFENDQKVLTEYAKNVVNRGRQEILNRGRTSNETAGMMKEGKSYQQMSQIQFEKAKNIHSEILSRDAKDPYYDGQIDLNKLKVAANGENNEVNFYTRGERLADFEKTVGGIDSFKYDQYKADYVKRIGQMNRERTTGNPNATKTIFDEATFWDDRTGKPGVTDQHAIEYLNSDPQGRVEQLFDKRLNDQLDKEIEQMKASGDARIKWMEGKSNSDIKNELINDPSKNLINQQDYGIRKRQMAKEDLRRADRINSKVSVDYKADADTTGGLYANKNIVQSYAFHNPVMQAIQGTDAGVSPSSNPGPGGVILQKNGKPIVFNSSNPKRTNVNTGITGVAKIGNVPFNLTGYQMQAFQSTGAPYLLRGNSTEEVINSINQIPLEHFDPNGKYKLQPEMKVALQGYTINQANVLNAANNQEQTIQEQIAQAQSEGDEDKVARLERTLSQIQGVRSLISTGIDDQELALAASRAGIKGVQVNELVQATDSDLANIKAITQGFDLKDQNYWNDDMRRVSQVYQTRAQEAAAAGYKSTPSPSPEKKAKAKKTASIPTISNEEEYSKLASGTEYIGPDGIKRKKK
jgi:hypothetical protein